MGAPVRSPLPLRLKEPEAVALSLTIKLLLMALALSSARAMKPSTHLEARLTLQLVSHLLRHSPLPAAVALALMPASCQSRSLMVEQLSLICPSCSHKSSSALLTLHSLTMKKAA